VTVPSAAFDRIVDKLMSNGNKVRTIGDGRASAQCPAHDDGTPSLSVTRIEGSVLLHCHGGCETGHVLDALGLAKRDLFDDPSGASYH
jgi:DNA primase